ncbi:MAG TPA: UDP-N-acetylmuramoyl-tripeptide--D-alanyl-D-alanine ligase [Nocardioidaceae bacterium]|nr:UDP-N-acetylmuramoyl-tripeptide--D-alanyl-D-alanine ligase [Nocardioidaceae bacterium]
MKLSEIAAVVGGTLHGEDVTVTGPAVVDSRLAEPGGLFTAFVGEQVDGHEYAAQAVERGAVAVLGTRATEYPTVVVSDPQLALQQLASEVLGRLQEAGGITVIALTGSQGKTSTKDLLGAVLADAGPTIATYGSFNNELGLPLTVLRATADTSYLVLEMGARGQGHLAELCTIARPDVSVVLNVGKAHLGEFGTQQDIARAKGELVEALAASGVAVLNADDPLVAAMAERTRATVVTFGEQSADVLIQDITLDDFGRPSFSLVSHDAKAEVELKVVGEHQALNAAAAAAAAVAVGVPLADVATSLGRVTSLSKWRMEVHELPTGVTVINDAYNANPDSMRAALKALAAIGRARGPAARTVAVLGEMRELGESSLEEHDALGRLAVRLDIHQLVVVGEAARPMHLGAYLEGSWGEESVFVRDNDEALAWLREHLAPGDVVLVKASRGARLEQVADGILAGGVG